MLYWLKNPHKKVKFSTFSTICWEGTFLKEIVLISDYRENLISSSDFYINSGVKMSTLWMLEKYEEKIVPSSLCLIKQITIKSKEFWHLLKKISRNFKNFVTIFHLFFCPASKYDENHSIIIECRLSDKDTPPLCLLCLFWLICLPYIAQECSHLTGLMGSGLPLFWSD